MIGLEGYWDIFLGEGADRLVGQLYLHDGSVEAVGRWNAIGQYSVSAEYVTISLEDTSWNLRIISNETLCGIILGQRVDLIATLIKL